MAFHLKTSRCKPDVPKLSRTPVLNVSAYFQKLPINVTGDDISILDAHLAQVPMRLASMSVDFETKQTSLILIHMSAFTWKSKRWTQHNIETLCSLTSLTHLVDLVRPSFVMKDYQVENLNLLINLEQGNLNIPELHLNEIFYQIMFLLW
jgi:hypothetical protein